MEDRQGRTWKQALTNVAIAAGLALAGYFIGGKRTTNPPETLRPTGEEEEPLRPGWHRPLPLVAPRPTYWPVVFGLGVAFMTWGVATLYLVSAFGIVLVLIGLIGWIVDLVRESEGAGQHES